MSDRTECGRFFAHPYPYDYEFCRQPVGHDGDCVFEPRHRSVSDQAQLAEIEQRLAGHFTPRAEDVTYLLAALREAERRAEEAESKLATATDTIRSLTALASEREAT